MTGRLSAIGPARQPRITHRTSGSWPILVAVWFGVIEREVSRRGIFGTVKEVNAKTRAVVVCRWKLLKEAVWLLW
jgi:hypothetical protein